METSSHPTKLQQSKERLLARLRSGEYGPGSRLPGGRQLARENNISYLTANNMLRELEQEGLVRRIPGIGTFVSTVAPAPSVVAGEQRVGYLVDVQTAFFGDFFSRVLECSGGRNPICNIPLRTLPGLQSITPEQHTQWLQEVFQSHWDSLVIYGDRHFPFRELQKYEQQCKQLNFVFWADTELSFPNANRVLCDTEQMGYMAGRHFIARRRSRLAVISLRYLDEVYRRRIGATLLHHGNQILNGLEHAYNDAHEDFYTQVQVIPDDKNFSLAGVCRLLDNGVRNFFVMGDFHAKTIYEAASRRGLQIGKDIDILGMTDIPLASMLHPTLSSISLHARKLGEALVELLHGRSRGKTIRIEPEIIIRESSIRD